MCYVLGGLHNHLTHSITTAARQGSKGRKSQSRFSFALVFKADGFSVGGCFFQCDPVIYMPHTLQDCVCVLAHIS